jgi:biotin operon repressor
MTATAAILAQLRDGRPHTTGQLADVAGVSRDGVNSAICRLNRCRHEILNVRGLAGHADGLYLLVVDADTCGPRRCQVDGCGTILSNSNGTPYCRLHLPGAALDAFIAMLESEGAEYEQLAVC